MQILLAVDDTDVPGHKPGTGRLARDLGVHLAQAGLSELVGVVRHQLLVDPRIPYTSHNSPACLILDTGPHAASDSHRNIFDEAARYILSRCADGSDPGLCLVPRAAVPTDLINFGWRAGNEVLDKAKAIELAKHHAIRLEELGGTGDGIIGALAAVGLTSEGNAGRFLEIAAGLRELPLRLLASDLRRRGITLLSVERNGEPIAAEAIIDTGDRVRPRMIGGVPVLFLERTEDGWRCYDRKTSHDSHNGNDHP